MCLFINLVSLRFPRLYLGPPRTVSIPLMTRCLKIGFLAERTNILACCLFHLPVFLKLTFSAPSYFGVLE
ncbi:MAG: hypothetical protein ABSG33_10385 [Candidatus Bathyarchaeia archaeon]